MGTRRAELPPEPTNGRPPSRWDCPLEDRGCQRRRGHPSDRFHAVAAERGEGRHLPVEAGADKRTICCQLPAKKHPVAALQPLTLCLHLCRVLP